MIFSLKQPKENQTKAAYKEKVTSNSEVCIGVLLICLLFILFAFYGHAILPCEV